MAEKRTRLSDQFTGEDPARGFDGYAFQRPSDIARLAFALQADHAYTTRDLMERIRGTYADAVFVLDSSFFDDRLDVEIWRTLLHVPRRIALLPHVEEELRGWVVSHASHPAARAVAARDSPLERVDFGTWDEDEIRAFTYYVQLLGLRKSLYKLVAYRRESELGRDLTEQEILQAKRQTLGDFGERAVVLTRKASGGDPSSLTFYTDEAVTTLAFFISIRTGRPAIVLTRDQDILEQFYKLQWLLDTQYRGHLLAEAYLAELRPTREMPVGAPWDEAFVAGSNNRLFERSDRDLELLLPERYTPARAECWLLRTTETVLSFEGEREIARLLDAKGRTGGLNTERLQPRNCHIWLGPLPVERALRGYAAIAEDRRIQMKRTNVALPMLDVNQALMTGERFKRPMRSDAAL
jgi:hypothetical protein